MIKELRKICLLFFSMIAFLANAQWQPVNSSASDNGNIYHLNGNVGIGIGNPTSPLHIYSEDYVVPPLEVSAAEAVFNFTKHAITLQSKPSFSYVPYLAWLNSQGTRLAYLGWRSDVFNLTLENGFNFSINGGDVGIGTASPSDNLEVYDVGGGVIRFTNHQTSYLTSQTVVTGNIRNVAKQWNNAYSSVNGSETSSIKFSYYADASGRVRDAAIRFYTQDDLSGPTSERMAILPRTIKIGVEGGADTGYGTNLELLGASLNSDRVWLARYNAADNQTELRVNIGDDYGQKEDMFVVGTHDWNGGTWYPHLAVQAAGNVGIGTTNTHGFRLAVAGKAIAEEVVVQLEQNWPDFVFDPRYKLPSLSQLEQFILVNRHLPDVPTAEQVQTEGVSLGQMNAILLQKIEELTLHLIQQDKINTEQAKRIDYLETQLKKSGNKKRR